MIFDIHLRESHPTGVGRVHIVRVARQFKRDAIKSAIAQARKAGVKVEAIPVRVADVTPPRVGVAYIDQEKPRKRRKPLGGRLPGPKAVLTLDCGHVVRRPWRGADSDGRRPVACLPCALAQLPSPFISPKDDSDASHSEG